MPPCRWPAPDYAELLQYLTQPNKARGGGCRQSRLGWPPGAITSTAQMITTTEEHMNEVEMEKTRRGEQRRRKGTVRVPPQGDRRDLHGAQRGERRDTCLCWWATRARTCKALTAGRTCARRLPGSAVPIYSWLLFDGYRHTHNAWAYGLRVLTSGCGQRGAIRPDHDRQALQPERAEPGVRTAHRPGRAGAGGLAGQVPRRLPLDADCAGHYRGPAVGLLLHVGVDQRVLYWRAHAVVRDGVSTSLNAREN